MDIFWDGDFHGRGGMRERIFPWRSFFGGKGIFHGGGLDLSVILTKRTENKLKNKFFSTESKEQY